MIFELPTKSARQQCLKGLISPDHMVALELGVTVIPVLLENQHEGIFYPTATKFRLSNSCTVSTTLAAHSLELSPICR